MIGVYCIYNSKEDKFYIGSSVKLKDRVTSHFSELRNNKHKNEKLQEAFNKCGQEYFSWAVVQECSEENVRAVEEFYINEWDTYYNGYNKTNAVQQGTRWPAELLYKASGLNHSGSKYSENQLYDALLLLADTTLCYSEIEISTGVDRSTISYLVKGGHSWLHVKYPDLSIKISNRDSIREESGIKYTNKDAVQVMKLLLSMPLATFSEISDVCLIPIETVSAISSGRYYKEIILKSELADAASVYYLMGRDSYKKSFSSMSVEISDSITKCIKFMERTSSWQGRNILVKECSISEHLARKLTEFDEELLTKYAECNQTNYVNIKILLDMRTNGKKARSIPSTLQIHMNNLLKTLANDDRVAR